MGITPNQVLPKLIELLNMNEELANESFRITITLTVGNLVQVNYETHQRNPSDGNV